MPPIPKSLARQQIDQLLAASGWTVQDCATMNLSASRGVAVREFPVEGGATDYMSGSFGFRHQKVYPIVSPAPYP
jgi:type I restriction enzyme R subunit